MGVKVRRLHDDTAEFKHAGTGMAYVKQGIGEKRGGEECQWWGRRFELLDFALRQGNHDGVAPGLS